MVFFYDFAVSIETLAGLSNKSLMESELVRRRERGNANVSVGERERCVERGESEGEIEK